VVIDPDAGVYPMVGPGQTYDQMITGDFIESRHKVDIETPGCRDVLVWLPLTAPPKPQQPPPLHTAPHEPPVTRRHSLRSKQLPGASSTPPASQPPQLAHRSRDGSLAHTTSPLAAEGQLHAERFELPRHAQLRRRQPLPQPFEMTAE